MKKIIPPIFFLLVTLSVQAQPAADSACTNTSQFTDSAALNNCFIFLDSSNNIKPIQLLRQKWLPIADYPIKKFTPAGWVCKTIYLRFCLQNSSGILDEVYFFPGVSYSSIKIYTIDNNVLTPIPDSSTEDGYQPLQLNPKEKKTFIAALQLTRTMFNRVTPQVIKKPYLSKYQRNQYYSNSSLLLIGYLFSGVVLMMTFFSAANYMLSGKKEFLYNSCYAACTFLLIFFSTYVEKRSGVLVSLFIGYIAFSLLSVGTVFYIAFTRKFLDTKKNYPLLNKIFLFAEWGFIAFWLCFTYLHFFTNNYLLQHSIENTMKISALLLGVLYIIIALVQKNKFMNYLALGNGMLIFFSSISLYILLFHLRENSIFARSIFYYEAGIVGELMFFLIGLTYKNRIDLIEKTIMQEALKSETEKQHYETRLAVLHAQQHERSRISADMHDDLGSGITAIRLYSELAKTRMGSEPAPEIEKISSSANELLDNMNAIIWTMNSSNDSLENMIAYIRSYAQGYFDSTGIICKINIQEHLPNIAVSGKVRRNVFMVVKESLNNILKHSKATQVNITLQTVPDGLALFIQDNGVGIDFGNLRRFGNGLINMKKRMEEMAIDFTIENKNGTLVTLHYAMAP